jgi:hypothetical protein
MVNEPFAVRRKIGLEWRYDRGEHTSDAVARGKSVNCGIV